MLWKNVLAALAVTCLFAGVLHADDELQEQLYGQGAHAYNQRDYVSAFNSLSAAIKAGSQDPRAYYFRGLTDLHLGRNPDAIADFKAGAELEIGDSANVYPVDRSLERIQGYPRQILEQYRTAVHAAAVQRREAERQARYEERAAAEQDVLRHVTPTQLPSQAIEQPSAAPAGPTTTPASGAEENPFAVPAGKSPKIDAAAKPAPSEDKNPFEAEPAKSAPATNPATNDNPFGEPQGGTAPPAKQNAAPANPGANNGGPSKSGALGGLFRAVTKGVQATEPPPATPAGGASLQLPGIVKGILGQGQSTPPATAENSNAPANAMPANGNASQAATAAANPPKDNPAAAAPPAGGAMPAAQGANPTATPPQTAPPAKDDNPFN